MSFSKETFEHLKKIIEEEDFYKMPKGLSREERRQFIIDCADGKVIPSTKGKNK